MSSKIKNDYYDNQPVKNNNTPRVYRVRFAELFNIMVGLFRYHNLPASLPAYEIEKRLILQGFAPIFKVDGYGVVTSFGSIYGVDIYKHATSITYSQPRIGSGTRKIGIDSACIYGTPIDKDIMQAQRAQLLQVLQWFARALTDIDVSITVATLKSRDANGIIAHTQSAKNALDGYYNQIEQGNIYVPFAPSAVFDNISDLIKSAKNASDIPALLELRAQIMRLFYASFGIQSVQHKSERLITDEIDADTDFLSANIRAMLDIRREGVDEINRVFGLNIMVEVANYVSL